MTVHNISANADVVYIQDGRISGVDNDHGTIRGATSASNTSKFTGDGFTLGNQYVSTIFSGINGITGALGGGTFNGGDQVIRVVTNDIAGVSNTVLQQGSNSANKADSIHQISVSSRYFYKTAVRTGGWHEFSGVFSPVVSVSNTGFWSQSSDADVGAGLGTHDHAANPTAATPGELVYRDGSPTPNQDDYAARRLF